MPPAASRGFTLLQLLFTMTIVGVLLAIVMTSTSSVRLKVRDKQRIVHMTQYKIALEDYIEGEGEYPPCGNFEVFSCLQSELTSKGYMANPPQDPQYKVGNEAVWASPTSGYHYDRWCQVPNGIQTTITYRLWAIAESPQRELQSNWWSNMFVGVTNCDDPS